MTISGKVEVGVMRMMPASTSKIALKLSTSFPPSCVSRGCLTQSAEGLRQMRSRAFASAIFLSGVECVSQFLAAGSGLLTSKTMRQPSLPSQRQKCA